MDYMLQDLFMKVSQFYDMMRIISIFMWVGSAIVIGFYAMNKGYSWVSWFFITLFFSPILGAILVAGLQDKSVDEDERLLKELNKIYEKINEISNTNKEFFNNAEKQKTDIKQTVENVENEKQVVNENVEELRALFESTNDPIVKKECAEKLVEKGYLYFNRYLKTLEEQSK